MCLNYIRLSKTKPGPNLQCNLKRKNVEKRKSNVTESVLTIRFYNFRDSVQTVALTGKSITCGTFIL